jgi:sensor histidine kinase YesM
MEKRFPFFYRIRTKLIISYAAIIVFTIMVISVVFFTTAKSIITRHVRDQNQFLLEQLSANLAAQLKSLEELQFNQYIYSLLGDLLAYVPVSHIDEINQTRKISECLIRLCYSIEAIKSAAVIDNDGTVYAHNISYAYDAVKELKNIDSILLQEKSGKAVWSIDNHGRLFMHRLLINIQTTKAIGQITVAVDPGYLTNIYKDGMTGSRGHILIFDGSGNFIPSMSTEINNLSALVFNSAELKNDSEYYHDGKQYIISGARFPDDGFGVYHILSLNELGIYTRTLLLMTSLAAMAAIIATIIVAHIISSQVTVGINTLIKGIRLFAAGDLKTPVKVKSTDEIGYLAVEFNRMADSINHLIENIYDVEMKKRDAETNALKFEYSALEAKINPHFIYNTLEAVNSLAKLKGADDISKIVCLLGNLLRDNISSTVEIIPLEKEIDNVYKYLEIQKLAYGEKFDIHITIGEDVQEAGVPKFILQPIVENALYHGILVSTKHGNIYLNVERRIDILYITIKDDGAGMSGEKLAQLLDYSVKIQNDNGKHTKVGIRAVDKRLKILYGDQFGLKIDSSENNGTIIQLSMPFLAVENQIRLVDDVQYSDI